MKLTCLYISLIVVIAGMQVDPIVHSPVLIKTYLISLTSYQDGTS